MHKAVWGQIHPIHTWRRQYLAPVMHMVWRQYLAPVMHMVWWRQYLAPAIDAHGLMTSIFGPSDTHGLMTSVFGPRYTCSPKIINVSHMRYFANLATPKIQPAKGSLLTHSILGLNAIWPYTRTWFGPGFRRGSVLVMAICRIRNQTGFSPDCAAQQEFWWFSVGPAADFWPRISPDTKIFSSGSYSDLHLYWQHDNHARNRSPTPDISCHNLLRQAPVYTRYLG